MKYNGFNVFDIIVFESDIGIKATSLVTLPATDSNFLHFGKELAQFKFANEEKRELIGAIMIPNKFIFRKIKDNSFYVNFTPEVIKELTSKMIASGAAGMFSVMHNGIVNDKAISVQEVWIKETENDKSIDFGIEEEIGTAFMKVKVNDDLIWKAVKDKGLNGFSIELDASIVEKNGLFKKVKEPSKKINNMKITDVFSNSVDVNGTKLYFNAELTVSNYVVTEDKDGKPVPYSGEFSYQDTNYKIVDGVITEKVDIKLSIEELVKGLATKFEAMEANAKVVDERQRAITEKEEEINLLKTQFLADKEAFEKSKLDKKEVKLNLSAAMSASGITGKEWIAKFSNKGK